MPLVVACANESSDINLCFAVRIKRRTSANCCPDTSAALFPVFASSFFNGREDSDPRACGDRLGEAWRWGGAQWTRATRHSLFTVHRLENLCDRVVTGRRTGRIAIVYKSPFNSGGATGGGYTNVLSCSMHHLYRAVVKV